MAQNHDAPRGGDYFPSAAKEEMNHNDPDDFLATWRYPAEYWDQLPSIHFSNTAMNETQQRIQETYVPVPFPPRPPAQQFNDTPASRELARFSRLGGPDMTDIRGYPPPLPPPPPPPPPPALQPSADWYSESEEEDDSDNIPSTDSEESESEDSDWSLYLDTDSSIDEGLTPFDENYETHLAMHDIHTVRRFLRPANYAAIKDDLTAWRRSLSPSALDPETFAELADNVRDEEMDEAMEDIIDAENEVDENPSAADVLMSNLAELTDGLIAPPKPGRFYGTRCADVAAGVVRKLNDRIVPSLENNLIAPNFFIETEATNVNLDRQFRYNRAVGARAMHALQNHGGPEPVKFDGNAYALTVSFRGRFMNVFSHHTTAPVAGRDRPAYHVHPVGGQRIADGEDLRRATVVFRNARDIAKKYRDALVERANRAEEEADDEGDDNDNDDDNDDGEDYLALRGLLCSLRKRRAPALDHYVAGRAAKRRR